MYTIPHKFYIIHDRGYDTYDASSLFRDSFELFKMRVNNLGNLATPTTDHDKEALAIMLEGLIHTKEKISRNAHEQV